VDGGERPLWSPTGDTIFYRSPADSMIAVSVATEPRLQVRDAGPLFSLGFGPRFGGIGGRPWDISPVDGRFLVVRRPPGDPGGVRVLLNWTRELRRLMGQ